ncbi:MAG: cytochrome b [Burkholderiales bacterium]
MPAQRYTTTAILLHWLMFLLIAASFTLGLTMVDLPLSPTKLKYVSWHKWVGVTVFLLAVVRVAWRLGHPPPPAAIPAWQRRAAAVAHGMLYGLIVATPLSGWIYSSAAGVPTVYLGLVQLPDLVTRDAGLADALKMLHFALTSTLGVLVLVHAAAALKHHFIDRDGVLLRMLPRLGPDGRR